MCLDVNDDLIIPYREFKPLFLPITRYKRYKH